MSEYEAYLEAKIEAELLGEDFPDFDTWSGKSSDKPAPLDDDDPRVKLFWEEMYEDYGL